MKLKHIFRSKPILGLLLAGALLLAIPALQAAPFRISQESAPGAGDFDANVLGYVGAFSTPLTAAGFYQYGSPAGSSYNGQANGGPEAISSLTQIFMVTASNGTFLTTLHDKVNDGNGGTAATRWDFVGTTYSTLVRDDNPGNDSYASGASFYSAVQSWNACCTDGYMIGDLATGFEAFGQFLTAPTGITDFRVTDAGGDHISLVLTTGRRVRIDTAPIPEPGTWALMGLGVLGLSLLRRRATNQA